MPARVRRSGHTTYGWAHQQAAARLRATFTDGTPCRRCHQPMWTWQPLDAGHPPHHQAGDGTLPDALEHAHCNRSAGAHKRNRQQKLRRLPRW